jgi:hypothetical protein
MRTRPGRYADALLAWFPPSDLDDLEVQAVAYRVACALLSIEHQFGPKGV